MLSESESESGFIGQVSLHKQGISLGKVTLNVLTQNMHYNTIQNKQCNSATVQWSKKFKKYIQGGMAIYSSCKTIVQRRSGECKKCRDRYICYMCCSGLAVQ